MTCVIVFNIFWDFVMKPKAEISCHVALSMGQHGTAFGFSQLLCLVARTYHFGSSGRSKKTAALSGRTRPTNRRSERG